MKYTLKQFNKVVKSAFVYYVLGLILSKKGKTCPAIASFLGITHDKVYKFLSDNAELAILFPNIMAKLANYFHEIKPGWLVIDDTSLSKIYAKYIEGVHLVYNSSLGRPERGLCIVVVAWTNGDVILPVAFNWWFSEEINGDQHKTKIVIAQELVSQVKGTIHHTHIVSDAAYISIDMINFHKNQNNRFINRIHSTRKVVTADGTCEQIKKHPALKLKGNQRAKITVASIQGKTVYIISFKRTKKNLHEYEVVYLVTNFYDSPKNIIAMYEGRWHIEPMFRTLKQSMGLAFCQARAIEKQHAHIVASFLAFAFVQHEKFLHNLSSSEVAVRHVQALKLNVTAIRFARFCRDFHHVA